MPVLMQAYRIDLDRVSHGSPFFQCVYVLCKCTPEVMNANKVAARALGFGPGGSYMPHLSLLYSAADEETRSAHSRSTFSCCPSSKLKSIIR